MKRYGFLFGAGAELAYKMPSGGQFALDIFRYNSSDAKKKFKDMRTNVDSITSYANDWLPEKYRDKNISVFGKSVFENIISSTVEHNRNYVIEKINAFDETALHVISKMEGHDVDGAFFSILKQKVSNIKLSQNIAYNDSFKKGNKLFDSNYFSALLLVYKDAEGNEKNILGRILLSVMQLQLGALSEDLTHTINDNLFVAKDDGIDIFDDFGELIQINYKAAGVSGLELLLENRVIDTTESIGIVLSFAQNIMEEIYSSVLDYKSLIDSNWHNLYYPKADWAKFCKISIFLLTVRQYISELASKHKTTCPDGYYNLLKNAIDKGSFEAIGIATTNYTSLIEDILENSVTYLNGSTSLWYDPYLNKIGTEEELDDSEHHLIVPLIFTQSGTKPMTAITMSEKYVDLYRDWKESDAIVVVGFGFGTDDEHINSILRTLVNDDGKNLIIVTKGNNDKDIVRKIEKTLKVRDSSRIKAIPVDTNGKSKGKYWVDLL